MTQSVRSLRRRIRSVENTHKTTRAMGMVSASKLSRTEGLFAAGRMYYRKMEEVTGHILGSGERLDHSFLSEQKVGGKALFCVITGDAGLCGTFNTQVLRAAHELIRSKGADASVIVTVGKKSFSYFRRIGYTAFHSFIGLNGRYSEPVTAELAGKILDAFLAGDISEAYIVYMGFESAARFRPCVKRFLPFVLDQVSRKEMNVEPRAEEALPDVLKNFALAKMRLAMLESLMAEHSSRMVAMKAASDNAQDLRDNLIVVRNKIRQAGITREMIELISSAEHFKG